MAVFSLQTHSDQLRAGSPHESPAKKKHSDQMSTSQNYTPIQLARAELSLIMFTNFQMIEW